MADSLEAIRNRIDGANDLQGIVRTMKAMSASSITQYENAVLALNTYYETVQQGLIACFKELNSAQLIVPNSKASKTAALIVFGSDQGLVGQFNDILAQYLNEHLGEIGPKLKIWVVGERMKGRLEDADLTIESCFNVPSSVDSVTHLIGELLIATEHLWGTDLQSPIFLFHHKPGLQTGQYAPAMRKLLPIDSAWQKNLQDQVWKGPSLPQTLGTNAGTLRALIREYLFVSIYQSSAESLASENASRLISMQRAEKNIEEMLADLQRAYHLLRQESIDAELFDVVAGFTSEP
jgi:F-type H+-transporting ATPase subunit gamma